MKRALILYLSVTAGVCVSAGLIDLVRFGDLSGKTYEELLEGVLQVVSRQFQVESTTADLIANPMIWLVAISIQYLILYIASLLAIFLGKAIGGRMGAVVAIFIVMFWVPVCAYVFGVLPAAAGPFGVESASRVVLASASVLLGTLTGAGIGRSAIAILGPRKARAERLDESKLRLQKYKTRSFTLLCRYNLPRGNDRLSEELLLSPAESQAHVLC